MPPVTVDVSDTWCEPVKLNIQPGETYRRFDLLQVHARSFHERRRPAASPAITPAGRGLRRPHEPESRRARHDPIPFSSIQTASPSRINIPPPATCPRSPSPPTITPSSAPFVCLKEVDFKYADGRVRKFESTNHVLLAWPYCNGMKTGYTDAAGHCLIASASNGSREIISVVLGDNGYV